MGAARASSTYLRSKRPPRAAQFCYVRAYIVKRLLARVLTFVGFLGVLTVTQNIVYDRREGRLGQIPKGASEAHVIELLGAPTDKTPRSWYYKETLLGLWRYDFRTDDMLVIFEDGKVEDAWMAPN